MEYHKAVWVVRVANISAVCRVDKVSSVDRVDKVGRVDRVDRVDKDDSGDRIDKDDRADIELLGWIGLIAPDRCCRHALLGGRPTLQHVRAPGDQHTLTWQTNQSD